MRLGDARIEVLTPTVLRLEYSPSRHFENSPTVNVLDRRMPVPAYSEKVSAGWLTLRTARVTLRYRVGSGPFTPANTSLRFEDGPKFTTVHPTWEWECPFDQTCQAGAAKLGGGASLQQGESGYESSAGYVQLASPGDSATWEVLGASRGQDVLSLRYGTTPGAPSVGTDRVDLVVDGRAVSLPVPSTDPSAPWSNLVVTTSLDAGSNSVEVRCSSGEDCGVDVDTISVAASDAATFPPVPDDPLGGWIRGFDTSTYSAGPTCPGGGEGTSCQNMPQPLHTDGLLDGSGWRLLDDSQSAVWSKRGWVEPRSPGGDVEDGYLFAYGRDYKGALGDFARLTGAAPLLPRSLFGVWYSDFSPFDPISSSYVEDSLYPAFESHKVPLDTLSLDTLWKSPNPWDGWEWDQALFPDPSAFIRWAGAHGIHIALNVHPSIEDADPKLSTAERIAGEELAPSNCMSGPCKVWNLSSVAQAESMFALQDGLAGEKSLYWWFDWWSDASSVSVQGVTPDSWIAHLYAQQMLSQSERGFVLARIGAVNDAPDEVFPAGPWSEHTSAIAFTGDTWGTWSTLAQEVALSPEEATIGEPYVSDDIGSYLGPPPQLTEDPPDLYDRWVQFGTFQPVLRLHSLDGSRLPWQYPQPVMGITEDFLRLREALIPYTYTLAANAHLVGLPMTQPLYLEYPDRPAAYFHPGEYLYGSDVLVAPVTSQGDVADTTVWFPPGRWVDYFTGATFSGPRTTVVSSPLDRMPVFVRAGGIVPEQMPDTRSSAAGSGHLVVKVYAGSTGAFELYGDRGTGLGYTKGQYTETEITDSVAPGTGTRRSGISRVVIGAAKGHYPGGPTSADYRLEMVDLSRPSELTINGSPIARVRAGSKGLGWYYDESSATVVVELPSIPVSETATVVASGARAVSRPEPG